MSAPIPRDPGTRIDPWHLVAVEQAFEGEAFPSDLPRLSQALTLQQGTAEWPARFQLRFGRDENARPVAMGRVSLAVRLVCQRCLDEVRVTLDGSMAVALIRSDAETEDLPGHLDPVVVDADGIRPLDLVEDELLLGIPQIPLHDQGDCEPLMSVHAGGPAEEPRRENPFAALLALRETGAEAGKGGEG